MSIEDILELDFIYEKRALNKIVYDKEKAEIEIHIQNIKLKQFYTFV